MCSSKSTSGRRPGATSGSSWWGVRWWRRFGGRAPRGAFRSNLHQGGSVRRARVTKEAAALALRSAALCGLEVAGVDFLETKKGLRVLEVNAAPGFKGVERATGLDIASRIVGYVEDRVGGKEAP